MSELTFRRVLAWRLPILRRCTYRSSPDKEGGCDDCDLLELERAGYGSTGTSALRLEPLYYRARAS